MNFVNFSNLGKILIFIGIGIAILGGMMILFAKVPFIGKLPGDINIQKENFTFYFPIISSIILSIVLTIILNIVIRFFIRK
jgi:hypothetical protein